MCFRVCHSHLNSIDDKLDLQIFRFSLGPIWQGLKKVLVQKVKKKSSKTQFLNRRLHAHAWQI